MSDDDTLRARATLVYRAVCGLPAAGPVLVGCAIRFNSDSVSDGSFAPLEQLRPFLEHLNRSGLHPAA